MSCTVRVQLHPNESLYETQIIQMHCIIHIDKLRQVRIDQLNVGVRLRYICIVRARMYHCVCAWLIEARWLYNCDVGMNENVVRSALCHYIAL